MPRPWRQVLASATKCWSAEEDEEAADARNYRPPNSEFSRRLASFRRLSAMANGSATPTDGKDDEDNADSAGEMGVGTMQQLHSFSLSELRGVTHDFSSGYLLGEGGFGAVHKGFVDAGMRPGLEPQPVAVKQLNIAGHQGHREWLAEVIFLGQFRHEHLLKLLGYCYEDEERLLVYEFMPRGSLDNHLFKRISATLPWNTRLKVAIGTAKGVAFLHGGKQPVIYRDLKASNILLDSDFTAKLSDFGLAKMGPEGDETHVSTRVMGTHGYAAPEYVQTGHLTVKSDVYSFGVVLLELLTGRRAMEHVPGRTARAEQTIKLVEWTRPYLASSRRLRCIMDQKLSGHYSVKGARAMAHLAVRCTNPQPRDRPSMAVVVEELEQLEGLKDMAVSMGLFWPTAPAAGRNALSAKFRAEMKGAGTGVVPRRRTASANLS